jgi:hypothetical protein
MWNRIAAPFLILVLSVALAAETVMVEGRSTQVPFVVNEYGYRCIRLTDVRLLGLEYVERNGERKIMRDGSEPTVKVRVPGQIAAGRSLLSPIKISGQGSQEFVAAQMVVEAVGGRWEEMNGTFSVSYEARSHIVTAKQAEADAWFKERMAEMRRTNRKVVTMPSAEVIGLDLSQGWVKVRTGNRSRVVTSGPDGRGESAVVNEVVVSLKDARINPPDLLTLISVGQRLQLVVEPYESKITRTEKGGMISVSTGKTRALLVVAEGVRPY